MRARARRIEHAVGRAEHARLAIDAVMTALGSSVRRRRCTGAVLQDQVVPALIAQLVIEGVRPDAVERAVTRVRDIKLGESICGGDPMVRAFAFEQAKLLDRGTRRRAER